MTSLDTASVCNNIMSDGGDPGTLGRPHKTLSAQLLLQRTPPRHTGFLRKRGKRDRLIENFKFAKSFFSRLLRWRQRFVVVSHGCIYVFTSETASTPLAALTLRGYNRLLLMESEQSPWTFRVVSPDINAKVHYFACHSDEDRKVWMKAIRQEMMLANGLPDDSASDGSIRSDVYVYLQKPVFEPPESPRLQDDVEDSDSDSDYDQIKEEDLDKMRPRIPLPPTPDESSAYKEVVKPAKKPVTKIGKEEHDYINRPRKPPPQQVKKPAPRPKPKPKAVSRTPSEAEYFFPENDRDKALTILRSKQQPGTYLVRNSRASENKVLAVITEDNIKEYKILSKDKKFTINNRDYYKSVEDLLVAYQKTPLPNRTTTLTRAFSSQDLSV